jgi:hypothetical protein
MCEIRFVQAEALPGNIPAPYPASRHIPEWFKNMSTDAGTEGTLKRCPPFLEAMTAGYIVPAPGDLRLSLDYLGITAVGKYEFLTPCSPVTGSGSPLAGRALLLFHNPWTIVTPPDYVCLVTAPINRFEMPLIPLAGIVETGRSQLPVDQPVICMMSPGATFDVPCGAPMIQVIPFRRDEWTSRLTSLDVPRLDKQMADVAANKHAYKDQIWRKLHFS